MTRGRAWLKGHKNAVVHRVTGGTRKYQRHELGDLNHKAYWAKCGEWLDGHKYNYSSDANTEITCKKCLRKG